MSPTESTLTLILALGADTRLAPLTTDRAKSAIPFGGNYRVIDFTLANCLRSGLRRVLVFTQHRSHSLQRHLHDGWSIFNPELGEFITSIPPQMMSDSADYAGAIDALYQNLHMVERNASDYVCVLSGEHVYRMDYAALIDFHVARKAAATIACIRANDLIYKDFQCRVEVEGEAVAAFAVPAPEAQATSLASMEVYVFSKAAFVQAVTEIRRAAPPGEVDPGSALIPHFIRQGARVLAYLFGGKSGRVTQDRYWRRIETLDDYYEANMDLLRPEPPIDLYQRDWSIRTYHAQNPPARTVPGRSSAEGVCINSIVASGTVIAGGGVNHSILFPRVAVEDGATVEDCILLAGVEVGDGARLHRCIVDKHVQIPPGETIGYDRARDAERFTVTPKGIVVVPKGFQFSQPADGPQH
ncbi:MAG: glucose-1-phosphate adenylyltransferase family protein [Chromatiales bacterium]